jgi:excinuclease ABC subunit A
VGTQRGQYDPRAHLGDDTEITGGLAVLFADLGVLACPKCATQMLRKADHFRCQKCEQKLPLPKPRHFSPKTYAAACQKCHGVGTLQEPRPEKLIQSPSKPLCNGAMYSPGFFPNGFLCKPYNSGYDLVQAFAAKYDFDPVTTPWNDMSPEAQSGFLFGDPEPMMVTFTSRSGNVTTRKTTFPGFYGWIRDWDLGGTYTETVPCSECNGAGLREPYRGIGLAGWTMFELRKMPLSSLKGIVNQLSKGVQSTPILSPVFEKILGRLSALCDLGLGYLHLDRYSATLSAGEAQRVKLGGLLGGGISGLTLLLDEPSRGLHPAEVDSMIDAMKKLRDGGNTVVVIEHDLQIIRQADNIIDMGPGAGRFGGKIVALGSPARIRDSHTLTGRWMRNEAQFQPRVEPKKSTGWLKLFHPSGNNLQMDCVEIPLGLLVGVCGVSGSGKSTLIHDTLGRILASAKQTTSVAYEPIEPEPYERLEGAPPHTIIIDQTKAGLHNPASFLGVEKTLRRLFAESDMAISSSFDEEAFKKNCTACKGRGYQRMDMGFLPDIFEVCEVCGGSGYPPEADQVKLNGFSLPEVMSMSIDEVYEIYNSEDSVTKPLDATRQVGLGYLILDQPGRTLSGGEAQRLKIAVALQKGSNDQVLYILDEPTVGQHLEDIQRLLGVLQRLVSEGGSVLVVEHHPHVLAACDWLIELGPGGGPEGGRIIAEGKPGTIANQTTPTAPYLKEILENLS